jgi:hypothetical protein
MRDRFENEKDNSKDIEENEYLFVRETVAGVDGVYHFNR